MPVLLFPWCLLNSWPELHSDFLVFIHVPLFTFQQSLHLWFAFKSHDLTLVPHAPGLLYPALHFRSVKAQALRGCILECKAPSCRGRSDFNSAIHSFICSFLHYFLSMWGYQLLGIGTMWDILWPCPVSSFVKSGRWQSCLEDQR